MKDKITLLLCLWLFAWQATAQNGRDFVEPQFAISYDGDSLDTAEGIYIPREGTFRVYITNLDEIEATLPEDATLTLLDSEAKVTRNNETISKTVYKNSEFVNADLDLRDLLNNASSNDAMVFEIEYVYLQKKKRKPRILKKGVSTMNVLLK
jgi:hypothetical protein